VKSDKSLRTDTAPPPPPRKSRAVEILQVLFLAAASGIGIVVLVAAIALWRTGASFGNAIDSLLAPEPSEPTVVTPTSVVARVRGASELTTAVFTTEAVVPVEQERKVGNLAIATTRLLYVARGEVRAGVDLQDLTPDSVRLGSEQVVVQLPAPEILDSKIDVTASRVYDYDRGFLNLGPDVGPQLQDLAARETLERIVASACAEGLLEDASDRAELTVQQLLSGATPKTIRVEVSPPDPDTCPT